MTPHLPDRRAGHVILIVDDVPENLAVLHDIGAILGTRPRTINKHLAHVLVKLGVETRTAAASVALDKLRALKPESGTALAAQGKR